MANTHHTGIPKLQWSFNYPPCTPSVTIVADKNPFCLGDSVTFTPTLNCVDTATIESYEIKYGALYNWFAATDERNICAEGWEVPTDVKFTTLRNYLGGASVAGGKLKETPLTYWNSPNTGATNEVKFNARGAGYRTGAGFAYLKIDNLNWSQTQFNATLAFYLALNSNSGVCSVAANEKYYGNSIRLIKTTTSLTHGQTGTYTGNDGKVYRTICIGTQEWLADNLAETKYRNGDTIPEVTDNAEWAALEDGAMCYYNNDINNAYTYTNDSEIISYGWVVNGSIQSTSAEPFVTNTLTNGNSVYMFFITSTGQTYFSNVITMQEKTEGCPTEIKYGLLYNWYAANDIRKITSSDTWVVPTRVNFQTFQTYLGGSIVAGGKLKEIGLTYWNSPNLGATNEFNWNGRGGGERNPGIFKGLKGNGNWHTSTSITSTISAYMTLSFNGVPMYNVDSGSVYKFRGFSVRLFRIATAAEQLLADGTACEPYVQNDSKLIRTVKIGTQVWLADNLAETKFRNGDAIPEVTDNAAWAALTTGALCAYNNSWDNV